jgi:hypothetical protein
VLAPVFEPQAKRDAGGEMMAVISRVHRKGMCSCPEGWEELLQI